MATLTEKRDLLAQLEGNRPSLLIMTAQAESDVRVGRAETSSLRHAEARLHNADIIIKALRDSIRMQESRESEMMPITWLPDASVQEVEPAK